MNIEVTGKVHKVLEETVGQNNTQKRTVIVLVDDNYAPYLPVTFIGKSYDKATCKEGDEVTISVNLGGREWQGKYFPSINGWKVDVHNHSSSPEPQEGIQPNPNFQNPTTPPTPNPLDDEDDDLPF